MTRYPQLIGSLTSLQTTTSLGVLRNHIASEAIIAVQNHLTCVFRNKRLNTIEGRAKYITQLFKSDKDHPIIWREYVEGDIQNHPEVGGYKTVGHFLRHTPSSPLRLQHRQGAVFSSPTLSWKRSSVTTPHPASWNLSHMKTRGSETDRWVSSPL